MTENNTALIPLPNTDGVGIEAQELTSIVATMPLKIESHEQLEQVSHVLKIASDLKKKVIAEFADPCDQAYKLHKSLTAMRTKHCVEPERIILICNNAIRNYNDEQTRKRLEAEAEQRRLQAEAEERARKEAEDERIAKAAEAEKEGDIEQAERLIEAPINTKPIYIPKVDMPAPVKTDTMYMRDNWSAEVIDISKLPLRFLLPNMIELNKKARTDKEYFNVPGAVARNNPTPISK